MSQSMNTFAARLSPEQVWGLAGVEEERIADVPPIAWLMIQMQAEGHSLANIAAQLGSELEDLTALMESVTGLKGDESTVMWNQAVMVLKATALNNQNRIASGWEEVESMAVTKLANALEKMTSDGDAMKMLAIATAANRSIRRSKGEGKTGGIGVTIRPDGQSESTLSLQSGDLGSIVLHLSPRVREQMSNPNRQIDLKANEPGEEKAVAGKNLQMLRLSETRFIAERRDLELAEQAKHDASMAELEAKKDPRFDFDLSSLLTR